MMNSESKSDACDLRDKKKPATSSSTPSRSSAILWSGATLALVVWLSLLAHRLGPSQSTTSAMFDTSNRRRLGPEPSTDALDDAARAECRRSCRLELAESVPENVSFVGPVDPRTLSTYEAWRRLIALARHEIVMAAYKSSLRGKHVLSTPSPSAGPGERIYEQLKRAGLEHGVQILAVENHPPKDPGDNEDARALQRAGALERRGLALDRVLRQRAGVMHSKFLVADDRHFYLGSANFDWRSLNQKLELGVLVTDCPCLARDLRSVFDTYWTLADDNRTVSTTTTTTTVDAKKSPTPTPTPTPMPAPRPALTSRERPLQMVDEFGNAFSVYLAASPPRLNAVGRTWDLDAIVDAIDNARTRLDIHVMDYVPMIVYQKPRRFWPVIDDAIRRAVVERNVRVRILTAALHFAPETFSFLRSLAAVGGRSPTEGGVRIRILSVPAVTAFHTLIARERRTHRKFLVTDDTVIVGTSNWSGDYFTSTTGAAIVVRQQQTSGDSLVSRMRRLFQRDFDSEYAKDLHDYIAACFDPLLGRDNCRVEKVTSGGH